MQFNQIAGNCAIRFDMSSCNSINNMEAQRSVSSTQNNVCGSTKKSRRFRSAFSTEQIKYLEKEFKKFPYIGNTSRQEIANTLNISERAIKIWFQNRRMKEKKDTSREGTVNQNKLINFNLTNDHLNNVNNLQSPNDEVRITTSLKGTNEDSNVNQEISKECKTSLRAQQVNQATIIDSREHEITTTTDVVKSFYFARPIEDHQKNTHLFKKPVNNKMEVISRDGHKLTNSDCLNRPTQQPQPATQNQEVPEDLSRRNTGLNSHQVNVGMDNIRKEVVNTPIYLQNCYTPTCVPGNVVLKPVNMSYTSLVPGIGPLPSQYPRPYLLNQPNLRKSNCNCDCHLQYVPQVIQDQSQGQFIPIFSIPYTNQNM